MREHLVESQGDHGPGNSWKKILSWRFLENPGNLMEMSWINVLDLSWKKCLYLKLFLTVVNLNELNERNCKIEIQEFEVIRNNYFMGVKFSIGIKVSF